MGFFSELKEDLSQAVNELMPDEEQTEDAVKREETASADEISLEQMLADIEAAEEAELQASAAEPKAPAVEQEAFLAEETESVQEPETVKEPEKDLESMPPQSREILTLRGL